MACVLYFNFSALRGRIREKFGSEQNFALAAGLSGTGLSRRLNGHQDFTSSEIARFCELLDLTVADVPAYFFSQEVALV